MSGVTGRAGPTYERNVADHSAAHGLPWDKGPPRGSGDLLDLSGTLPAGFLVGCKAIRRGSTFGEKISEAMDQCDRALLNLARKSAMGGDGSRITWRKDGNGRLLIDCGGIVPVQVMQRSGFPIGKHYVVTQLDYFLDLAVRRQKWRDDE